MGFGGKSSTKSHTETYLTFRLKVRASHLWVAPYNEYQHFLFETITDLREKGHTYDQIADWLNQNGYTTPRGKKFRSPHAHSIVKKKKKRDVRIRKRFPPKLPKVALLFLDNTLINQ